MAGSTVWPQGTCTFSGVTVATCLETNVTVTIMPVVVNVTVTSSVMSRRMNSERTRCSVPEEAAT